MKRLLAVLVLAVFSVGLLAGCSGSSSTAYKDGEYSAKSDADERGNWGEIKIKVSDGKISEVDFKEFVKGGAEKDENYGKGGDEVNYKKAQDALKAAKGYAPKLVETQDVDKVDVVSGATSSHTLFKTIANKALEGAKK